MNERRPKIMSWTSAKVTYLGRFFELSEAMIKHVSTKAATRTRLPFNEFGCDAARAEYYLVAAPRTR